MRAGRAEAPLRTVGAKRAQDGTRRTVPGSQSDPWPRSPTMTPTIKWTLILGGITIAALLVLRVAGS